MIDAGNEAQVKQTGLRPVCRPHAFPATRVEAVVQNEHDLLLWLQFEQRLNVAPYSLASMISIKQNKTDRPSLLVQFRYHIPQYPGRISRTEFDVWEFTGQPDRYLWIDIHRNHRFGKAPRTRNDPPR